MDAQLDAAKAELRARKVDLFILQMPRLKLCVGNLLIRMGKLVLDKAKANDKTSIHRLQQSLQSVGEKQLDAAGIPSKFLPYLKNISKVYCCFLGSPWL
jgi:hypothetical protein